MFDEDNALNDEIQLVEKKPMCVIMPESKLKTAWNIVITVLLLYTATFVPYKTAFLDDTSFPMIIFESFIDFLFITDIFVNFCSAYESKKGIEVSRKKILCEYFKTWFFLDLIGCVPVQLMELDNGGSAKLLRLARLPRLYRLIRILRLFKMFKLLKYNKTFKKMFDAIKMNSGIMRMISVSVTVVLLVHLCGCAWFLSAKF